MILAILNHSTAVSDAEAAQMTAWINDEFRNLTVGPANVAVFYASIEEVPPGVYVLHIVDDEEKGAVLKRFASPFPAGTASEAVAHEVIES